MIPTKMTVLELINALKKFPEEMLVLTDGYEYVVTPQMMEMNHHPENPYYSGEFQEKKGHEIQTIHAVVISRNRRTIEL